MRSVLILALALLGSAVALPYGQLAVDQNFSFPLFVNATSAGCPDPCGFIMQTGSDPPQFLKCETTACVWVDASSADAQLFSRQNGDKGQDRFVIYYQNGQPSNQCLDREHCHSDRSNSRMSDCNHCGAIHWQYQDGELAEDNMKNCIQSDGSIDHCSQKHQPVTWPKEQTCNIVSQTVTNIECASGGTTCSSATFESGSVVGASSETDCNACNAPKGSTLNCNFNMQVSTSHTVSNTMSASAGTTIKDSLEFGVDLGIKATNTISFELSTTLTRGSSKTVDKTETITSGCSSTILAGTKESMKANFLSGTVKADFKGTLTTTYDCPQKQGPQTDTVTGTLSISQVPTSTVSGSCAPQAGNCTS